MELEKEKGGRKRQHSNDQKDITNSAVSVLHEVVGQLKNKTEKKKKKTDRTENEKYCLYSASQLENLTPRNQVKTRKKIDDIIFEINMEELEDTENNVSKRTDV